MMPPENVVIPKLYVNANDNQGRGDSGNLRPRLNPFYGKLFCGLGIAGAGWAWVRIRENRNRGWIELWVLLAGLAIFTWSLFAMFP